MTDREQWRDRRLGSREREGRKGITQSGCAHSQHHPSDGHVLVGTELAKISGRCCPATADIASR
jgi:hypothetical protein